uniref:NitT/TauT family transport system ATP-binding protein n=1 Tax=Candidatus Kentrum sp. FM TaxID=2126340 RepID=A0A450TKK2_9GAMM|nr:MAG: NitT/TauT family transport system ATP-binding protein [Candidatus Kentron sp. FM]VFJ68626.1 MAG: NitT/TauT family transport system ATP-binding protein [Candidatus Kentron sp. FM]VFK16724.1 MAG: NitT/TauT family transport system ATP-binding protein [Candidatus Kentron sp. FM]
MGAGEVLTVIDGLGLHLRPGEFVSILGPSGCGKSTLLNILAGEDAFDAGTVRVQGRREESGARKGPRPKDNTPFRLAVVWQQDSLMPWKSALGNIEFPLIVLGESPRRRKVIARTWLEAVGLTGFEDYYPSQLSQGMRQRVSLAAALATRPGLLLMDEPFGALDVYSKLQIEKAVIGLWEEMDATILMVTHDVQEAVALSDRVIMLTPRPSRVVLEKDIDLPRPRDLDALYGTARFHTLVSELWNALAR